MLRGFDLIELDFLITILVQLHVLVAPVPWLKRDAADDDRECLAEYGSNKEPKAVAMCIHARPATRARAKGIGHPGSYGRLSNPYIYLALRLS